MMKCVMYMQCIRTNQLKVVQVHYQAVGVIHSLKSLGKQESIGFAFQNSSF